MKVPGVLICAPIVRDLAGMARATLLGERDAWQEYATTTTASSDTMEKVERFDEAQPRVAARGFRSLSPARDAAPSTTRLGSRRVLTRPLPERRRSRGEGFDDSKIRFADQFKHTTLSN